MNVSALGLIFADTFEDKAHELVAKRTMAAIPFGSRYRIIDFPLSSMVNAGIKNVGIITREKYHSLMGHVRSGAEWDLDRKTGGLFILPPYSMENIGSATLNRLGAIRANQTMLHDSLEEYVVFLGGSQVANIDVEDALRAHVESGARVTILYTKNAVNRSLDRPFTSLQLDGDRVTGIGKIFSDNETDSNVSLNAYIFSRIDLIELLKKAGSEGLSSLRFDVIGQMLGTSYVHGYEVKSPVLFMDDLKSYLKSNLALLDAGIRDDIFSMDNRPILTKTKDSPPTKYGPNARAENSLIADGAIIEGHVRNSIIFRGVHVREGAVVENSVVMQNSDIGYGAKLDYAVLDKRVKINDGRQLSGYITHPFFVETNGVI